MNTASRYPWPVLGDEDAVSGTFAPIVKIPSNKETITVRGDFNLDNKSIQDLISDGRASYVLQVTCVATHMRRCYLFTDSQFEVSIPAADIRGVVWLDYFVLATKNIVSYVNEAAHPDYEGAESGVSLTQGDILAEANPDKFDAKKRYAGSRAVSDILKVERDPNLTGPMSVDPDKDKIIVRLPGPDFDKLAGFAKSKEEKVNSILQSGVAFPAIMIALQYAFEDQNYYGQFIWFNVLKDRTEKAKIDWSKENIPNIAQEILRGPVGRMLSGLREIEESTE